MTPARKKFGRKLKMRATMEARYWFLVTVEIKKPWVSATVRKALAVKKRAKREPRIGTLKRKRLKTTQTAIDPMPRM